MPLERGPRRRTRRAAQVGGLDEETAAAHHAIGTARGALRVLARRDRVVIAVVPVMAPLEYVARHVERAVRRCVAGVVTHGLYGVEGLRTDEVRETAIDGRAPGIAARVGAARGFLPLRLGGQAITFAGARAQPRAVGRGRVPVHADHGIVVAVRSAAAVIVGLGPVGNLVARYHAAIRPEFRIVVTVIVAELLPLAVRDLE